MKNFPSQALILTMEPQDLGPHMLKYMMRGQAETNRFNFMQMVYPGQIAERFMEAWGWLEREGFIAHRPNDINGHGFFVTRAGQRVAQSANFNAMRGSPNRCFRTGSKATGLWGKGGQRSLARSALVEATAQLDR